MSLYSKTYWEKDKTISGATQNNYINPVLEKVHNVQQQIQLKGNIGEIGVHEGKSFTPLLFLLKDNEVAVAVDCFELQKFNIDKSGKGNFNIFKTNCSKFVNFNDKVAIHKGDSTKMKGSQWIPKNGMKFKIFSIDGCHTKDATYKDMQNVFDILCDDGVMIIDDYLNVTWPGVKAGVDQYMFDHGNMRPIFLGYNKLFLVKKASYNKYWKEFRNVKDEIINGASRVYKSKIKDVAHFEERMKIGHVWK